MDSEKYYRSIMAPGEYEKIPCLETLTELMEFSCSSYGCNSVFIESETTYSDLNTNIRKTITFLNGLGLKRGSHIGMLMDNSDMFVEIFLSIVCAGFIAIPISKKVSNLSDLISRYNISIVIGDGETVSGTDYIPASECRTMDLLSDFAQVSPDDTAVIMFSSGTAGGPKGVVLSHRALTTSARYGCYAWGKCIGQRYFNILPFTHIFGLVRSMLTVLYTGSSMYNAGNVFELFTKLPIINPSYMVMVPAMADLLLGMVSKSGPESLGNALKCIICGGAFTSPKTIKRLLALGCRICPGYGMTETANLVSGNAEADLYPDSSGPPYPGLSVKIVNNELCIKGNNIMTCYYNDPEETEKAIKDGWLMTGDLARLDSEGRIYILGRKKDVIINENGENIFPEILENKIIGIKGVQEAVIYTKKNSFGSTIIATEILPEPNHMNDFEYFAEKITELNSSLRSFEQIADISLRAVPFERSASLKIINPYKEER